MIGPFSSKEPEVRARYLKVLQESAEAARQAGSAWLRRTREEGLRRFSEQGFPSFKQEAWRYTRLGPFFEKEFLPSLPASGVQTLEAEAAAAKTLCPEAHAIVLLDGFYCKELSDPGPDETGAEITELSQALSGENPGVQGVLDRAGGFLPHAFDDLNDAFLANGLWIRWAGDRPPGRPLHLIHLATAGRGARMSHPRQMILLAENARGTLIESFAGTEEAVHFRNSRTQVKIASGAGLDYFRVVRESRESFHFGRIAVRLEAGARLHGTFFKFGGRLVRTDTVVELAGPQGECALEGLSLVRGEEEADHHVLVDHQQAHGTSRQFFKGIAADRSRVVFSGKVLVRPGAQKTEAGQTNKNLILGDHAIADVRPELEIYADDVKCYHGAATGRLDPKALFYCQSRGLGRSEAQRLLCHAFAGEVAARVRIPSLRERIEDLIAQALKKDLGGMDHGF
ncbi:MAG: Fe-S cluster assembly protein SufD [Candidatus Omnitrophota bacterium]